MKRTTLVLFALAGVVLTSGLLLAQQVQQPPQDNVPGMPTLAKIYVLNRDLADAVGVRIQDATVTLPVAVMGTASVTLAPNAVVSTRTSRQGWEYRQLTWNAGQDITDQLNKAGLEGWEAVATAPGTDKGLMLILKRPR